MRLAILLAVMLAFSAHAQVERRDHAITASGLSVAFPGGYACEPISSPFASLTRYDNSVRRGDRNGGLHGGMDLSLEIGTPLLAIADSEVIALGEGGALEGIYIWLRSTPINSGSPFFVFSKCQHLSALPTLKVGDRVKAGKVVGLSGATGTVGKHYGPNGYAHLHLSTFYGPSDEYEIKGRYDSMVSGKDARLDDPLILYLDDLHDLPAIRSLPDERKTVHPAVAGNDGRIYPEGRKTVWPVSCKERTKR
ncbi:MAG: M23 family metallopeptidase [Rhodocyclales bacterium]|nr:M23 family metallopeptidase [Rhodocyclales bacterium]